MKILPFEPSSAAKSPAETMARTTTTSIADAEMSGDATSTRINAWDAIRGLAALMVVTLHAGVAYLRHPMPGLAWPTHDGQSGWVDVAFWSIEIVVMPLFLIMAGFLAWETLQTKGSGTLVKSRLKRLLKPFLFGCLVILPLDLYIWVDGWVIDEIVPLRKLRSFKFDGGIDENLWGLSHLWFLPYLMSYIAIMAAWFHAAKRLSIIQRIHTWGASRSIQEWSATLFLIAAGILVSRPEVVWGFQHSFLPVASKWAYCGLFFAGGITIGQFDRQLKTLATSWRRLTPIMIATGAGALLMGMWHLQRLAEDVEIQEAQEPFAAALLAGLTVVTAILGCCVMVGAAASYRKPLPSSIRFLSAASFWIYLVHHPVVGLLHIDLKFLLPSVAPELKFAIATSLAVGISAASYQVLVRRSRFGQWLGMSESRSKTLNSNADIMTEKILTLPPQEEVPTRRAA